MRRCNARRSGSRTQPHVPTVGGAGRRRRPMRLLIMAAGFARFQSVALAPVPAKEGWRAKPPAQRLENGGVSTPAMTRRFVQSAILVTLAGTGGAAFAGRQSGEASEFIGRLGDRAIAILEAPGISPDEREARWRGF